MSQLAAQLNALAGRVGRGKDARRVPRKPSFLFDAKQAAELDAATIYSIGLNGFAELRKIDERFAPFEDTLFGARAGAAGALFDRGTQSKEVSFMPVFNSCL